MEGSYAPENAWEYDIIRSDNWDVIEEYGAEGWELINVYPIARNVQWPRLANAAVEVRTSKKNVANLYLIALALIAVPVLFFTFWSPSPRRDEIPISVLVADVWAGEVTRIVAREDTNTLVAYYGDGRVQSAVKEPDGTIQAYFLNANVPDESMPQIVVERASSLGSWLSLAFYVALTASFLWLALKNFRIAEQYTKNLETAFIFKRRKSQSGVAQRG